MSGEIINILTEFKSQLTAFFDELIEQFPMKGDLVVMRLFIASQLPLETAIIKFYNKVNGEDGLVKKMVKNRNIDFFLKHNVFDDLGETKSGGVFKELWEENDIDQEDLDVIWQWVDALIYIADKYAKYKASTMTA